MSTNGGDGAGAPRVVVLGGGPAGDVAALRDWAGRIGAVHLKDVRMDVLERARAERADMLTAWRWGLFCALGEGDVHVSLATISTGTSMARDPGSFSTMASRHAGSVSGSARTSRSTSISP